MRGAKRLAEEAVKEMLAEEMDASLRRMELDMQNRIYVAWRCGDAVQWREYNAVRT